ncbi:protein THALLO [Malania oleifera]|uniref:protein THALLO n=1 Tax=Malania oleifera TaxID=397392 RepID=UPI0025ADF1E9|nr:protein THALLO [Malania oleifera]
MGKRGRSQKKDSRNPKRRPRDEHFAPVDMDDEIDAFHKQRGVIPLDVNEDAMESDEDNEQPVFDYKDINDDDDDEGDDDDMDDDTPHTSLVAKIKRQQKFLRAKMGGVEDEMHDDEDEDEEGRSAVWGGKKHIYHTRDDVDYEKESSDDDLPAMEEAEVLRLQREKAKNLSMEDFGLEDVTADDGDGEPTIEEILVEGKVSSKSRTEKEIDDDTGTAYMEVKKDLAALSREEQMDVVYSSAPELVGLLSELNDALKQLESKVNPLLSKVKKKESTKAERMNYLEVKQLLLLAYCQAITFYLFLKSEGHPIRDHPVIARLVEIKNLLDKMNQLDGNLQPELEEILQNDYGAETEAALVEENAALASTSSSKDRDLSGVPAETQEAAAPLEKAEAAKVNSSRDYENKGGKSKSQNNQVGIQSMKMLEVRAALEEKLRKKGIVSSVASKRDRAQKHLSKPMNGQLETLDDFDDDTIDVDGSTRGLGNGKTSLLRSSKISQLVTPKVNKPKVVSGDDDLPKRDDVGERRRKHELRVLARAGIKSEDDDVDGLGKISDDEDANTVEASETEESEDEFYKQVKEQRAAKLAAKAEAYSRTSAVPSLPESVDGKRQISYQMEKNRGLTRARKKLIKNPRKKYKLKHKKAVVHRKGQVREIKKPAGPYGGEASGINAAISRSIRFKN